MIEPQKNKKATNFIRYTGIGFQMLATIGVFAFAGYKIDGYRNSEKLIFTALLGLLGVIVSLYQIIRQLNNRD
ncbi:hypothetical protein TH53_06270 [Pedobacter lusitanus]|uniref:Uncharacterized protein n=1 Tax=Pedobacter lusitanus TaxID=1503925 RepID=A0A0D0F8J4_9SPHI|nr:AtpZ/AtpI family protein [Pedobacter lusitanus]KIO78028.1 hypothetical protein TH53_06270 [Pedobacter lusitanus]